LPEPKFKTKGFNMSETEQIWEEIQKRQVRELEILNELLLGRAMKIYGNAGWRATIRGYISEVHAQECKLALECIRADKQW